MRQANQQFSTILTEIRNGEQLNEMEINLIESRFCTVEEVEASRCPQGILIGQRKGPLRGRVCGGRVVCVVGDGSKERSAESSPRGRGTWLRMARRWLLAHIKKSSMALALDRARQHVMCASPLSSFGESPGGYNGLVRRKVLEFVALPGHDGARRNPCSQKK
ncbi:hypothetical protein TNCV_637871 [Trichonephila clavipes]|nr:hypothetical protein TNCV_637871 [Trichonephila clavipes]